MLGPACRRIGRSPSGSSPWVVFRSLIVPPDYGEEARLSIKDVIREFTKKAVGEVTPFDPSGRFLRNELPDFSPKTQEELEPRRMSESFERAVIPLGSDVSLRDRYTTVSGQVRIGRILEDMDVFSVYLCYKHLLNPRGGSIFPQTVVTALVDHIRILAPLSVEKDVRLTGQVTWTGKSSLQAVLEAHQKEGDVWVKRTDANFLLASRNTSNMGKCFVNPVLAETPEEQALLKQGEMNKKSRIIRASHGLFDNAPKQDEGHIIHDLFVQTLDNESLSFKSRVKPPNSVWMEDSKLKTVVLCQPENRNRFNKIFGGYIMRQAAELAWINCYTFCGKPPSFYYIDDIIFKKPVEIGSILYLNSQVCYTQDNFMQTRVSAEIFEPFTKKNILTNVLEFTFKVEEPVPSVVPKSYQEAVMYLHSRRHFLAI